MEPIATVVTVGLFVGLGYLALRAYVKGGDHGLNGELFD